MIVSFFDLSLTNTEIISQYRLTYTPHSGLNSLPLYEIERRSEQIFIIYRWQHADFKSVFYKSPIRACSFDNSLAANQNVRSYVQTINHRALRICKKRIQKVLMLSSFFLINISSYLLSDSYMQHYLQIRIYNTPQISPSLSSYIYSHDKTPDDTS